MPGPAPTSFFPQRLPTRKDLLTQAAYFVDGQPVGCGRVRLLADTAQLGAVTVVPAWQGKGVGSALTVAASELAASLADLVWLRCSDTSRALYERLGYWHADDHALLVAE